MPQICQFSQVFHEFLGFFDKFFDLMDILEMFAIEINQCSSLL